MTAIGIAMIYAIYKISKHFKAKQEANILLQRRLNSPARRDGRQLLLENRDLKKRLENLETIVTSMDKEIILAAETKSNRYTKAGDAARLRRMLDEV